MSYLLSTEFYLEVRKGNVPGHEIVQKFGRNKAVPNGDIAPLSIGGNYRTPTVITQLRLRSSDAGDNAASTTGARKVTLIGLGTGYAEVTQEVTLNGLTNVTVPVNSFFRLYRSYISESGVYANQDLASHIGEIIIEDITGADEWLRIDNAITDFGVGQSQVGAYSVPAGKTAYLLTKHLTVNASKPANVFFFQRNNIDDISIPYSGCLRLVQQHDGIISPIDVLTKSPLAVFEEKTDIGFMAVGDGADTSVSVDFELLLVDN